MKRSADKREDAIDALTRSCQIRIVVADERISSNRSVVVECRRSRRNRQRIIDAMVSEGRRSGEITCRVEFDGEPAEKIELHSYPAFARMVENVVEEWLGIED